MKITYVLLISVACLALSALASPIQIVQVPASVSYALKEGRQQVVSAPSASAPAVEEDEDDDDDDDIEDALDDDDDDDDEEETPGTSSDDDEEEDDDYIERFFDDILGDDDDDDDDDVSPSTGIVQSPSAPSQPSASAPSAVAATADDAAADYPIGDADSVVYDDEQGGSVDDNGVQIIDTAPGDAVKEPTAPEAALPSIGVSPLSSAATAASASGDDDDDDEEEDDITDALDDEDDDDDDEEESDDEEDDDEDDLIGDDVIEARKSARSLVQPASKTDGASEVTPVPDILINKYNRFVDGIFGRINKILARSYDPVNVRLTATETTKTKTKKTAVTGNKKRKSTKGKTSHKSRHAASASTTATSNNSSRVTRNAAELPAAAPILVGIPDSFITTPADRPAAAANSIAQPENRATQQQKRKKVSTSAATSVSKPKQTKPSATHKIERARGVLYGLSTLKRQGNVRVNVMADHTTVKSNFLLGPLQLRVEKAFGRGVKRELKSATATTTEMVGRIKLRIVNGAATLHSIKVQQPKQVQVVSADNHDRTREFVWKKSSHIADVVSQKLTSAVRSMLQPPPNAVTAKRSTQRKAKVMQF